MAAMHMANSYDPASGESDPEDAELLARRHSVLGAPYRLFYSRPVALVRGAGSHLFDSAGEDYLDAYNNVPVIGHSHPRVAEAVSGALTTLSTHTRYLTDPVVSYAEELTALMPEPLSQVVFACSGSEAVDLSLRVARHVTGRRGVIITSHAYHGTTQASAEISPSLGPNNAVPGHVVAVSPPDPTVDPDAEQTFAAAVEAAASELERRGHGVAALIVDSILISDGLVLSERPLLRGAAAVVRTHGGLYIADEVQAGFGRTGSWWGFAAHDVVPDLVVLGKPMGNGMPISAVVGRPEHFDRFGRDVRYFNTFAGNGACIAAAGVVLDEIADSDLRGHATRVGARLMRGLRDIVAARGADAAVRGRGLVVAVELGEGGRADAARHARAVVDGLRDRRILVSASGPGENVVKIRPPLVFDDDDVDRFLEGFDEVLRATG
jgi:4-aminobutyrate aminotransferase-like enzyme